MPHDVFISYATRDKVAADATCNVLERNGIRCWMAPRDIAVGHDWAEAIVRAIRESRLLVLVFSDSSNSSPHLKREVERAINKGIPVVPVRIENVTPSEALEYFISSPHWLDAFPPPLETHLEKLAAAVGGMLNNDERLESPVTSVERRSSRRSRMERHQRAGPNDTPAAKDGRDDDASLADARPPRYWLRSIVGFMMIVALIVVSSFAAYRGFLLLGSPGLMPQGQAPSTRSDKATTREAAAAPTVDVKTPGRPASAPLSAAQAPVLVPQSDADEIPTELHGDITVGSPDKDLVLDNSVIKTNGYGLKILAKDIFFRRAVIVSGGGKSSQAAAGKRGSDGLIGQKGGAGSKGADGVNGFDAKEIDIFAKTFRGDLYINNSGGQGQDGGNGGEGGTGGTGISGQRTATAFPNCVKSEGGGGSGGDGGEGYQSGGGGDGGAGGSTHVKLNVPGRGNGVVGGDGGDGGSGGDGGRGGVVILKFDTMTPGSEIRVDAAPGHGGKGGAGGDGGLRGPGPACTNSDGDEPPGPAVNGGRGGSGGASLGDGYVALTMDGKRQIAHGQAEFRGNTEP